MGLITKKVKTAALQFITLTQVNLHQLLYKLCWFQVLPVQITSNDIIGPLVAMAAANEVARVMAEAAAMVQETWKDMAGGLGAFREGGEK